MNKSPFVHQQLSTPSKTFLVGEYLVLWRGGPALLLNTAPRFKLDIHPIQHKHLSSVKASNGRHHLNPNSPATEFIQTYAHLCKDLSLDFYDPHKGAGGFGASSAEFVMASYALFPNLSITQRLEQYHQIVKQQFRRKSHTTQSNLPSGVDVVSQLLGNVALIQKDLSYYHQFDWPFPHLCYCLIRTGRKVPTHDHLKNLLPLDKTVVDNLQCIAERVVCAFKTQQAMLFCQAVQDYGDVLMQNSLITKTSKQLVSQCLKQPGVLATKGCGALGADTVLVLVKANHLKALLLWASDQGLETVVSGNQTSQGLYVDCA